MEVNKKHPQSYHSEIIANILLYRFLYQCVCVYVYVCILFETEILPQLYENMTLSTSEETGLAESVSKQNFTFFFF